MIYNNNFKQIEPPSELVTIRARVVREKDNLPINHTIKGRWYREIAVPSGNAGHNSTFVVESFHSRLDLTPVYSGGEQLVASVNREVEVEQQKQQLEAGIKPFGISAVDRVQAEAEAQRQKAQQAIDEFNRMHDVKLLDYLYAKQQQGKQMNASVGSGPTEVPKIVMDYSGQEVYDLTGKLEEHANTDQTIKFMLETAGIPDYAQHVRKVNTASGNNTSDDLHIHQEYVPGECNNAFCSACVKNNISSQKVAAVSTTMIADSEESQRPIFFNTGRRSLRA